MRGALYHTLPTQPAPFEYRVPNLLTSTLSAQPVSPGMPPQPLDLEALQANNWRAVDPVLNLLETTLQPAAASPFIPIDFGQLRATGSLADFALPNLLTGTLAPAQQAIPFAPIDFPPLPKSTVTHVFSPTNLLTSVFSQPFPLAQHDWPNIAPLQLLPQQGPAGANFQLLTLPPPASPFLALDWPNLTVLRYAVDAPVAASGITMQGALPPVPPVAPFAVTPGKLPPWPWSWTHDKHKPDSPEFVRNLQKAMLREQYLRAEKSRLEREFKEKKLAAYALPAAQQKSALQNRNYAILRRKIRSVEEELSGAVTKEIELRLRAVEYETAQSNAVAARRQRELMMVLLLA